MHASTFVLRCLAMLMACAALPQRVAAAPTFTTSSFATVNLGAAAGDAHYDPFRNLVYVSLPSLNEVAIVNANTRTVVNRVFVGSSPQGIDMSADGQHLYVALNQGAAVTDLNLNSLQTNEIVVGTQLGSSLAYDVVEARPGRVFVSGNPGSGGFANIAMIKTDAGNAVSRVAGNRIIRAGPKFLENPQNDVLYVGEGFSPNSLYKLNILDDTAPIVLEDDHGSVSGTQTTSISPSGTRIYLSSGQVLRSDTFLQAGTIGSGIPAASADGSVVYVGSSTGTVGVYSASTFLSVAGGFNLPASTNSLSQLRLMAGDVGMFGLRGPELVMTSVVPEPSTLSLLGLAAFGLTRRRR